MDLTKLFEMQKFLREKIIKENKLEGQDLLPGLILALMVELGELANEQRSWKHWSKNKKPRTKALRAPAMMEEDKQYYNPLLDEYADGLHLVLELGLELGYEDVGFTTIYHPQVNIIDSFLDICEQILSLEMEPSLENYAILVARFFELGEMLGFTWEQIEIAYYEKNSINHKRQEAGY